jgi:hypothetical protein
MLGSLDARADPSAYVSAAFAKHYDLTFVERLIANDCKLSHCSDAQATECVYYPDIINSDISV